jgi:indole-3-glycerol phosphate synthase
MIETARDYGMEPLVEVHDRRDAQVAMSAGARLTGINNRDKDTLKVDIRRTERLSRFVSGVTVSASGIETQEQLAYVLESCDAALIGSALMRAPDAGEALKSLVYGGKR